jgi:hypothetical protein
LRPLQAELDWRQCLEALTVLLNGVKFDIRPLQLLTHKNLNEHKQVWWRIRCANDENWDLTAFESSALSLTLSGHPLWTQSMWKSRNWTIPRRWSARESKGAPPALFSQFTNTNYLMSWKDGKSQTHLSSELLSMQRRWFAIQCFAASQTCTMCL